MIKALVKIINFNQVDLDGNIFTKDTKFHFPPECNIVKKDDGIYLEYEVDEKINELRWKEIKSCEMKQYHCGLCKDSKFLICKGCEGYQSKVSTSCVRCRGKRNIKCPRCNKP